MEDPIDKTARLLKRGTIDDLELEYRKAIPFLEDDPDWALLFSDEDYVLAVKEKTDRYKGWTKVLSQGCQFIESQYWTIGEFFNAMMMLIHTKGCSVASDYQLIWYWNILDNLAELPIYDENQDRWIIPEIWDEHCQSKLAKMIRYIKAQEKYKRIELLSLRYHLQKHYK